MSKRQKYFIKQKLIGVLVIIGTLLAIPLLEGDATIAILTVPLGLHLMFSKKKVWTDEYFFEQLEKGEGL